MAILAYSNNYEYLWELGCALCKDCAHVIPADKSLLDYSPEDIQKMYIHLTGDLAGCIFSSDKVCAIILTTLAKYSQNLPSANVTSNFAQQAIDKNIEYMHIENGKIKEGFASIKMPITIVDKMFLVNDTTCNLNNVNFKCDWKTVEDIKITQSMTPAQKINKGSHQRMTGSKQIIWDVATSMWLDAGSPTDKGEVLSLRKQIMNELEKQGVNRNSASNELGKWHKETAPF
ncbi:hypothetical protein PQD09_gp50 [Providencia phage PSTCR4]|uniref:Uncharacterized protein n=1 Tax=Providencia phage PSTCR4 TaxID=2783546 RepID=A0A873WKY4_9CAUD|nr:hypothetical protein PQD09_gp50 [Providencia phage PSTCR4]QPB12071.1 hypothetical protein [Providencia phage PSTCR4]